MHGFSVFESWRSSLKDGFMHRLCSFCSLLRVYMISFFRRLKSICNPVEGLIPRTGPFVKLFELSYRSSGHSAADWLAATPEPCQMADSDDGANSLTASMTDPGDKGEWPDPPSCRQRCMAGAIVSAFCPWVVQNRISSCWKDVNRVNINFCI